MEWSEVGKDRKTERERESGAAERSAKESNPQEDGVSGMSVVSKCNHSMGEHVIGSIGIGGVSGRRE